MMSCTNMALIFITSLSILRTALHLPSPGPLVGWIGTTLELDSKYLQFVPRYQTDPFRTAMMMSGLGILNAFYLAGGLSIELPRGPETPPYACSAALD